MKFLINKNGFGVVMHACMPHVGTQWGFILPHKCYELVLDAVKDRDDVCFLIAGSEERNFDYWLKLQKMAKDLNVEAEIVKTGFLAEDEIPVVFGATDVCCFPYLTGIDSGCLRYALGSKVLSLASPAPFIQEIFQQYACMFRRWRHELRWSYMYWIMCFSSVYTDYYILFNS